MTTERTVSSKLLKVEEVAELLNVSRRTVYTLVEIEKIPHAHVGGQIRFLPDVLDEWLREGGNGV